MGLFVGWVDSGFLNSGIDIIRWAIASVTPADIQRVAKATFKSENRTIGKILPR
ncbi:MAG: hypothetical protein KME17_09445 [Cyanosarcina radialis HA8281-LM2]|nr:hypothetical protein [Cyanosarcina radialis HA8281-LM2]